MIVRARMTRRRVLAATSTGTLALFGLMAAGCSGRSDGPVPIKIGRDVCEHCRMIIGDGRFAAEAVSPRRPRAAMFDDIGCTIAWATDTGLLDDTATRLFAADMDKTRQEEAPTHWLDARQSGYRAEQLTPMGYGFGATALPVGGEILSFAEVRKAVLANLNCVAPQSGAEPAPQTDGRRS